MAVGFSRAEQRFRAHRARLREQEALAETHVVFEQIDHLRLAFDPLGDQADAEPAEQVGQIGGMNVGAGGGRLAEQNRRRHFDIADAALAEIARFHAQIGDGIHAEQVAELAQCRQALGLQRPRSAQCALPQFQDEGGPERPVGVHELQDFREQLGSFNVEPAMLQNRPISRFLS